MWTNDVTQRSVNTSFPTEVNLVISHLTAVGIYVAYFRGIYMKSLYTKAPTNHAKTGYSLISSGTVGSWMWAAWCFISWPCMISSASLSNLWPIAMCGRDVIAEEFRNLAAASMFFFVAMIPVYLPFITHNGLFICHVRQRKDDDKCVCYS